MRPQVSSAFEAEILNLEASVLVDPSVSRGQLKDSRMLSLPRSKPSAISTSSPHNSSAYGDLCFPYSA